MGLFDDLKSSGTAVAERPSLFADLKSKKVVQAEQPKQTSLFEDLKSGIGHAGKAGLNIASGVVPSLSVLNPDVRRGLNAATFLPSRTASVGLGMLQGESLKEATDGCPETSPTIGERITEAIPEPTTPNVPLNVAAQLLRLVPGESAEFAILAGLGKGLSTLGKAVNELKAIGTPQAARIAQRLEQAGLSSPSQAASAPVSRVGEFLKPTAPVPEIVRPGAATAPTGPKPSPLTSIPESEKAFFNRFSPGARKPLAESRLSQQEAIQAQRRGIVSDVELQRLADNLDLPFEEIVKMKPGTILNAEGVKRTLDLADEAGVRVNTAVQAGDFQSFQKALEPAMQLTRVAMGIRTELGRALRSLQLPRGSQRGFDDLMSFISETDFALDASKQMKLFQKLRSTPPGQRLREIQKQFQPTFLDKMIEFSAAVKLTSPKTFLRNEIGNTIATLFRVAEIPLAAGIDTASNLIFRTPRSVFLGETKAFAAPAIDSAVSQLFGATRGLYRGSINILDDILRGRFSQATDRLLNEGVLSSEAGKAQEVMRRGPSIGGRFGQVVRTPFRGLSALDQFHRSINGAGALNQLAYRTARTEGLSGAELVRRVDEIIKSPPPQIQAQVKAVTDELLFQEQLSSGLESFNKFLGTGGGKLARLTVFPYFRTPVNLLRFGARRSPLGIFSARNINDIMAGGASRAEALARLSLGSGISAALFNMALEGKLTGNGPTSSSERDALMRTGWRPNSIFIDGNYIPLRGLEPISFVTSMAGEAAQAFMEKKDASVTENIGNMALAIVRNFADNPFVFGLKSVMDAVENPETGGGRFIRGFITGQIPSIVRTSAFAMDPVVRRPVTVQEAIMSNLPGLSERVRPRRDALGRVIERPQRGLASVFSPIEISPRRVRAVDKILRIAKSEKVGFPSKSLDGVALNPNEQDLLLKLRGQAIIRNVEANLDRILETSDREEARRIVNKIIRDAGEEARAQMRERKGLIP